MVLDLLRKMLNIVAVFAALIGFLVVLHFPWSTGRMTISETTAASGFYEEIYAKQTAEDTAGNTEHVYVEAGRAAGDAVGITESVREFVLEHDLETGRVLEVGAGSGQLQDVVEDYTGLDIAASAARYFHKPFVQGSATDLPFEANEFDSAWTVWTLEHVDDPEKGFSELRRVTKPGGLIYLFPAWNCPPWLAGGYAVRPYGDLDLLGKVTKASLVVRKNPWFRVSHLIPTRALWYWFWSLTHEPTTLRYHQLEPTYEQYWTADTDATVSMDSHEAMIWFQSRGDECLNCPEEFGDQLLLGFQPLIIRVNKAE